MVARSHELTCVLLLLASLNHLLKCENCQSIGIRAHINCPQAIKDSSSWLIKFLCFVLLFIDWLIDSFILGNFQLCSEFSLGSLFWDLSWWSSQDYIWCIGVNTSHLLVRQNYCGIIYPASINRILKVLNQFLYWLHGMHVAPWLH